jgi:hypothetical protein
VRRRLVRKGSHAAPLQRDRRQETGDKRTENHRTTEPQNGEASIEDRR